MAKQKKTQQKPPNIIINIFSQIQGPSFRLQKSCGMYLFLEISGKEEWL